MFAYSPDLSAAAGFAVVTDRFVCLLSRDASLETARSVFRLLDGEDANLEDAFGMLSQPDVVERFAVVELLVPASRIRVAVRGHVSVGIEGTMATRPSAPGEAIGIRGEAHDVRSLWLSLEEDKPDGELLPLRRGVVRTLAVVAEPTTAVITVAKELVEPESEPDPTDQNETGTLHVNLDEWMNVEGAPRWVLRLPDGNELEAEGTIVIGRKSWESAIDESLIKHVSAPSPKRQISGSHLELALVDGELVARDLDSTNGTIVLTPEHPPRLLHGGSTTSLQAGDILDIGESFRIVVSNKY
ncbi:MAG: FHA domain-containing protein [Salinibacterium sp.]|nr:FHA domain-containing protein [Salinibacterium sp.]